MWVVSVFSSLSIRVSCISVSGISGCSVLHSLSAPVFRMTCSFVMGFDGPVCIAHAGSGAVSVLVYVLPSLGLLVGGGIIHCFCFAVVHSLGTVRCHVRR